MQKTIICLILLLLVLILGVIVWFWSKVSIYWSHSHFLYVFLLLQMCFVELHVVCDIVQTRLYIFELCSIIIVLHTYLPFSCTAHIPPFSLLLSFSHLFLCDVMYCVVKPSIWHDTNSSLICRWMVSHRWPVAC